jgi:hypothetical protein
MGLEAKHLICLKRSGPQVKRSSNEAILKQKIKEV